jgi:hypothetical protein
MPTSKRTGSTVHAFQEYTILYLQTKDLSGVRVVLVPVPMDHLTSPIFHTESDRSLFSFPYWIFFYPIGRFSMAEVIFVSNVFFPFEFEFVA